MSTVGTFQCLPTLVNVAEKIRRRGQHLEILPNQGSGLVRRR
jgi:hypothetical protein